jgi:hypothetical protein
MADICGTGLFSQCLGYSLLKYLFFGLDLGPFLKDLHGQLHQHFDAVNDGAALFPGPPTKWA